MEINIINKNKIETDISELKVGTIFFFIFDGMNYPYMLIACVCGSYKVFDLKEKQLKTVTGENKVRLYNKAKLNLEI